jgi:hypothetical protein
MADELTRCANCGAPFQIASPACHYCGAAKPGGGQILPPPPPEISQAIASIRSRMGDPQGLLAYLSGALAQLGAGTARPHRSLFGSKISRLRLTLGAMHYEMWQDGPACVVERQAVAAGMAVGMKDRVPASRWPELLVLDVARAADEKGLGWQAVNRILS